MAFSIPTLARQKSLALAPGIARLAGWRVRQMWRLLLVTWLGLLAMVVLVSAGPLFTSVASSAYLRSLVDTAPDGPYLTVEGVSTHMTQDQVQQIRQTADAALEHTLLGTYQQGAPQLVVQTPAFDMLAGGKTTPSAFLISGYDSGQAAQHTTVVQGRLPQVTTDGTVEIAIAQDTAVGLGLHVGSTMQGRYPIAFGSQVWNFRVVGLIAPRANGDRFWAMGNPFAKSSVDLTSNYYNVVQSAPAFTVLAANEAIRPKIAPLQITTSQNLLNSFIFFWRYRFDLSHLDVTQIDALSRTMNTVGAQLDSRSQSLPDLTYVAPFGTLYATLSRAQDKVQLDGIGTGFLILVTLGLVLFLVSLMSNVLVEKQAATIATLRSRGATRLHVFGSLFLQGLGLSLAALLLGPFLAILLVCVLAQILLTPESQQSLAVITSQPVQAALSVKWYAACAVVVSLVIMLLAINRALKLNIVTLRRESARATRVPFWRMLNLDLFFALLLLAGYVAFLYFWPALTATEAQINPVVYVLLTNLGFIGSPLLVIAVLLLFLRFFPLLTRLATNVVAHRRSAPAVLALAQMEREPRAASRMVVLLALALASCFFLTTLIATKDQRNDTTATFYAGGADFSGYLPASNAAASLSALRAHYSGLKGVQSATIGYRDVLQVDYAGQMQSPARSQGPTTIDAVDADTYAQTADWSVLYSSQPLSDLTAQLISQRSTGIAHHLVYALVDTATWRELNLTPGAQFTLPVNAAGSTHVTFVALAQIHYIPGVYDTSADTSSGTGLIVDFQNYAAVKGQALGEASMIPNYLWLRTRDDAAALASVRNALPELIDRRATLAAMQVDPDHLGVIGVLALGVGTALILALLGMLISSWVNASQRLTTFAVLRALGMTPRQIAAVLLWEQGFIYGLALLLGLGLGGLLTIFAAPTISALTIQHGHAWDAPLNVPPIQVVVPYAWLLSLLGVFVLICLAALLLMARIVARPSLSQTLRLNED